MVTCSNCGRELPGVEFDGFIPKTWQCAECRNDLSNSLYCRRGDAVRYSYPKNGTLSAQLFANKYLVPGDTYYVDSIKILKSVSYIKIQGLSHWFNSVVLERVT